MPNPISTRARAIIYTVGVGVGIVAVIIGPMLALVGAGPEWSQLATSIVGAVTTGTAVLSRANLSQDVATDANAE